MPDQNVAAVILAAGKGTRMHSDRPKVLQTLLAEPMLHYVYAALDPLFGQGRLFTVVGFGADQVRAAFPARESGFVLQAEQLGTGHALQSAWPALRESKAAYCLVINGDTPLVSADAMRRFVDNSLDAAADVAFLTITPDDPAAFGRVLRDPGGRVASIVEAKDYDAGRYGAPREVNAGIYCLRLDAVEPLLSELRNDNKSGEYYVTDLVGLAVSLGLKVEGVACGNDVNLMGINSPLELAEAEAVLRRRIVQGWLKRNVMIHHPESAVIGPRVVLEPGAELTGPCELYGETSVARGAAVASHTVLMNTRVEAGAEIRNFSHLDQAHVGPGCQVGPYARLRPGAVMEQGSRVGNFVEMKKAVLRRGAKANHLTYLGDADIGEKANVGAGTITCNYDGKNKFRTVIKAGAFIGSNTALVAPVTVGENALVGAGSVVTKDVPDGQMAIARARQTNLARKIRRS